MSNIFNLLDGIGEPDKGQVLQPMQRSKTYQEIRPNSTKAMGGTKVKGLSIRSNSDMNMFQSLHPTASKKDTCESKEHDFLKPKLTQFDSNGCPISPRTEAKRLLASSKKEFASKEDSTTKKIQKPLSDIVLKKPLSVKKSIKKFPDPEKLAPWCDNQHEFDHGYIDIVEREFKDLLMKEKENIRPQQENILISETPSFIKISEIAFDRSVEEEYRKVLSPDSPEISDISDDDYL